jgi:hypothetical protein
VQENQKDQRGTGLESANAHTGSQHSPPVDRTYSLGSIVLIIMFDNFNSMIKIFKSSGMGYY